MLPSVSGDLLLHLVYSLGLDTKECRALSSAHGRPASPSLALSLAPATKECGFASNAHALFDNKTAPPKRAKSVYQSQALPFCYAWRRQDLHSACAEHYRNGNYETLRKSPSHHPHVRRRPHCEHSACADVTAITKLFGQSWTPFKQPSRHQRRLDCTRTPSTTLRTRQLRASESQRFFGKGNAKIHWEQEQRPVKLRIWYGLFCMSIRALYFLFVLFIIIQRCEGFLSLSFPACTCV